MPLSFFLCHLHSVPVSILKLARSWSNTPVGLQNTFCPPLLHMGEMVIYIYLNQRQDFFWSCFQIWGICPAATRISWRKVYHRCQFSQDCIRHAASKRLHSSDFPSFLKSTLIQSIGSESWLWTRHCAGATDKGKKKTQSLMPRLCSNMHFTELLSKHCESHRERQHEQAPICLSSLALGTPSLLTRLWLLWSSFSSCEALCSLEQ